MEAEVKDLVQNLESPTKVTCGSRTYHLGRLEGKDVVIALSRIGKVASASTITTLIDRFKASTVIFTGVAGGIAPYINIGDVVLATQVLQCDMDASALVEFKKFEIPLLGKIYFDLSADLRAKARTAIATFIKSDPKHNGAKLVEGIVASCDRFVVDPKQKESFAREIPGLLAVEMEGGSVGQVCFEWNVPLVLIRSISDTADHNSHIDFNKFLVDVAAPLSAGVVRALLRTI